MRQQHVAFALSAFFSSLLLCLYACSSSSPAGMTSPPAPDAGVDGYVEHDAGGDRQGPNDAGLDVAVDASHLPFPQLVYGGAPLVRSPKIVTITFPGDSFASALQAYGAGLTQSAYWSEVIADYCQADGGPCMGQPGVSAPLTVTPAATYVDTSTGDPTMLPDGGPPLTSLLTAQLESGALPPPDDNTIYLFYFPSTTTVNLDGADTCNSFDGYHNQMTYTSDGGTTTVVYAVSMECSGYALGDVTLTTSHEIAEAATDGIATATSGGWYLDLTDPNTFGWNDLGGGEVGDMCVDYLGLGQDRTTEGSYTTQRIWSVSRAKLGQNPCVPIPAGEVYFNAAPEKALFVANVGETRTFFVTGFDDAPHADWTLTVQDVTVDYNNPTAQYLQVSIQGGTTIDAGAQIGLNNGRVVQVSFTLLADPSNSYNGEADGLLISTDTATLSTSTQGHAWPFTVLTPATADADGVKEPARRGRTGFGVSKGGRGVFPGSAPVHRWPWLAP